MSIPLNAFQPTVANPLHNFVNAGLNQTDAIQDTQAILTEARESVAKAEKLMIIAAVALAAIGVIVAFTLGAFAIIPFVMSAALVYGVYNLERVKTNIDDIIADPSQYALLDMSNQSISINSDQIKAKLKEKTLGFDWAIDLAVNKFLPVAT